MSLKFDQFQAWNVELAALDRLIFYFFYFKTIQGERTGLVVRASDSGLGDLGSILGRVGVLLS